MPSQEIHPKWWQLYLTFPLMIVLFAIDFNLKLSASEHQAVQIGILLIVYGLVHLWLKANAAALSKINHSQFNGAVNVTRIPSYQLPDIKNDVRPMFQLPDAELKGTLSSTFEMDYIDAEFIPMDEAVEDSK